VVAVSAFIHEHDLSLFTSSTLILPFLPMNVIQLPSKSSVEFRPRNGVILSKFSYIPNYIYNVAGFGT